MNMRTTIGIFILVIIVVIWAANTPATVGAFDHDKVDMPAVPSANAG